MSHPPSGYGRSRSANGTVTAVVCAGFDEVSRNRVLDVLGSMASAGLPVGVPPRLPPHITLAAVRLPRTDLSRVLGVVKGLVVQVNGFPLDLDHLGLFPRGGVIWLGPAGSSALSAVQERVDVALRNAGWNRAFGAQSDPERWLPHCTLATRLSPEDLGRAITLLTRRFRPVPVRVNALITVLVGGTGVVDTAMLRS